MKVFSIPGENGSGDTGQPEGSCEVQAREPEKRFIEATAGLVCDILNVGWNDRRIVHSLLINGLKDKFNNRWKDPGLLQQYGAYVLEEAAGRFYYELGVPKEIKVNHSHAEHAKYADIVTWIHKNYKGPKIEPESIEPDPMGPQDPQESNSKSKLGNNARG